MNLSGEVTAIGGLRSKLYGAKNAGCKTVLFPKDNLPDFEKINRECTDLIDENFSARPISTITEAISLALNSYEGIQMNPDANTTVHKPTHKRRRAPDDKIDKQKMASSKRQCHRYKTRSCTQAYLQ